MTEAFDRARRRFLERWCNIPGQFLGWTFHNCDPKLVDPAALDAVKAYVEDFDTYASQGIGLLLWGPPGRGKTGLLAAAQNELMFGPAKIPTRFSKAQDYIRDHQTVIKLEKKLESDYSESVENEMMEVQAGIDKMLRYPLASMDDVGKEYRTGTGYAAELLDYWIRTRYSNLRPSFMTSNEQPEKWGDMYSPSMRSYLNEACIVIEVNGKDIRKRLI